MDTKQRMIFHSDCNAFYASVEEVFHPELKKVPMAICGDPESRHGIILAKNELAKGFGVKTAETIWQAKRKCPNLVLAPARHGLYSEYCEQINGIYGQYTDQVERFGIDESYLDVTGSLRLFGMDGETMAHAIRKRIKAETGLTVSVGVSFNKIFAKLASDMKKPDAVTVIDKVNYREKLWPLPVSALLMVGKTTEQKLLRMQIRTIGDLAQTDEGLLAVHFGKMGEQLHWYANGLEDSPVLRPDQVQAIQSIGNGMTFRRDLVCREDIRAAIIALSDTVAARMRRSGLRCNTVQVTIKDTLLQVITRQKPLPAPSWLAKDLSRTAMELIEKSWAIGKPIRMLTVTGQKLVTEEVALEQTSLFVGDDVQRAKGERLEKAIDTIRSRYGTDSIMPGCVVVNDLGLRRDGENPNEGPLPG